MRATDSLPDQPSYAATPELAWLVLWLICVAVIVAVPTWQVAPLDAIWISLAVLYGFRIWPSRRMLALTAMAAGVTIAALCDDMVEQLRVVGGPVSQIPLLATMVAVMAWQAHRWVAADGAVAAELDRLRRLSDELQLIAASPCIPTRSSVTLTTSIGQRPRREDGSG